MSISERIDLEGNVSAQARKWQREIARLAAAARKLPPMFGGGGRGGPREPGMPRQPRQPRQYGPGREEFYKQRAKEEARAAREQAKAARETEKAARAQAKAEAAKVKAEGRASAKDSATRARQEAAATKAAAKEQAKAAKAEERAANAKARAQQKAWAPNRAAPTGGARTGGGRRGGPNDPALPRREVGGIGGMMNSLGGNLAADAAAALASALASVARSMASTFAQARVFRESSIGGLEILLKSGTEAKKTWEESFKLARETGATQQQAMSSLQTLMARGFKSPAATDLFKVMTAFSSVNPAANVERIVTAISQIKAKGKLTAEELHGQLGEELNIDQVYEILSKRLKTDKAGVIKMMEDGRISAEDGIAAVRQAMVDTVGGEKNLDKVLAKKANSWASLFAKLNAAPMTFFSGLDDVAGGDSLKASLRSVIDLLDPSTDAGKRFAQTFGVVMDKLGAGGAKGIERLVEKAPQIADAFVKLADIASGPGVDAFLAVVDAIVWGAEAASSAAAKYREVSAALKGLLSGGDVLRSVGSGLADSVLGPIGALYRHVVELRALMNGPATSVGASVMRAIAAGMTNGIMGPINAVAALPEHLAAVWAGITSIAGTWGSSLAAGIGQGIVSAMFGPIAGMAAAGYQMVMGLAQGINGGASAAIQAAINMATAAMSAAKGALGIASPSKVFAGYGQHIDEGLAKGIRENIAIVDRDAERLAGAAMGPMAGGVPFIGDALAERGVGNRTTYNTISGMRAQNTFHVSTPQAGGAEAAAGFQQMFDAQMAKFWEKMAS